LVICASCLLFFLRPPPFEVFFYSCPVPVSHLFWSGGFQRRNFFVCLFLTLVFLPSGPPGSSALQCFVIISPDSELPTPIEGSGPLTILAFLLGPRRVTVSPLWFCFAGSHLLVAFTLFCVDFPPSNLTEGSWTSCIFDLSSICGFLFIARTFERVALSIIQFLGGIPPFSNKVWTYSVPIFLFANLREPLESLGCAPFPASNLGGVFPDAPFPSQVCFPNPVVPPSRKSIFFGVFWCCPAFEFPLTLAIYSFFRGQALHGPLSRVKDFFVCPVV